MKKLLFILAILLLVVSVFAVLRQTKIKELVSDLVKSGNSFIANLAIFQTGQGVVAQKIEIQKEVVDEFNLKRLPQSGGLKDVNSTDRYVEEESAKDAGVTLSEGQISYYQAFVTPNDTAVQAIASGKQPQAIYQEAVSWVWVPDIILNNQEEKWLSPHYFLTQTPKLATNPVKGKIASDCESQAYTLVSALRASGIPAEEVRVVTGQVNFGGVTGGHAWVELYDKNSQSWFQLEPTSGNYYDSETGKLVISSGLPFEYFKTYKYPSVQIWTYFNDKYFFDNNRRQGNAPDSWLTQEIQVKKAPEREIQYIPPENLRRLRPERIITIIITSQATESAKITPLPSWLIRRRERTPTITQEAQPTLEPTPTPTPSETTDAVVNETNLNQGTPSATPESSKFWQFLRRRLAK